VVLDSSASKLWNNGDKLLKKFIGDDLDSEIEMCAETRSGHRGPVPIPETEMDKPVCAIDVLPRNCGLVDLTKE